MRRLLLSRMRILNSHGFYGLLLMHMRYCIDEGVETACTDGERITFSPVFLESLSERELDFVMMHEVLHVVLHHCIRGEERNRELFNIACDIVVNSNILLENGKDRSSITLSKWGESMHLAPDGKEGYCYTAEQVYDMLSRRGRSDSSGGQGGSLWDDHSQWREQEGNEILREVWVKQFAEACAAISVREKAEGRGLLPRFAQRMLEQLQKPQVDWRTILNEFVQEEINDYSFSPPDRRYQDTPFFLPDFNELGKIGEAVNILFMIDTSGSMTDREITAAFSEVKGALDQFDGKLKGWLGFFDAAIIEPQPFESVEDVLKIKPAGGGGTDFGIIFEYVHQQMCDEPPACIIILTDGFSPFPKEKVARDIPVLWLINNDKVEPPWGKVARIEV
jgi:predicted metal-dependent peptidase